MYPSLITLIQKEWAPISTNQIKKKSFHYSRHASWRLFNPLKMRTTLIISIGTVKSTANWLIFYLRICQNDWPFWKLIKYVKEYERKSHLIKSNDRKNQEVENSGILHTHCKRNYYFVVRFHIDFECISYG